MEGDKRPLDTYFWLVGVGQMLCSGIGHLDFPWDRFSLVHTENSSGHVEKQQVNGSQ